MGRGSDKFDGVPVDIYEGRFQGAFPIDELLGEELAYDDVVGFFVIGTLAKANVGSNAHGDVKRTNYFTPTSAVILPNDRAKELADEFGVAAVDPSNYQQVTIYDELGFNPEDD